MVAFAVYLLKLLSHIVLSAAFFYSAQFYAIHSVHIYSLTRHHKLPSSKHWAQKTQESVISCAIWLTKVWPSLLIMRQAYVRSWTTYWHSCGQYLAHDNGFRMQTVSYNWLALRRLEIILNIIINSFLRSLTHSLKYIDVLLKSIKFSSSSSTSKTSFVLHEFKDSDTNINTIYRTVNCWNTQKDSMKCGRWKVTHSKLNTFFQLYSMHICSPIPYSQLLSAPIWTLYWYTVAPKNISNVPFHRQKLNLKPPSCKCALSDSTNQWMVLLMLVMDPHKMFAEPTVEGLKPGREVLGDDVWQLKSYWCRM